ncbi:MAG: hypothetical protein GW748_03505 [Alphaproteobacteria bacterium]|nr:hypothetical protein [Alphaproteobacteria bacterium]NCQ66790.1 hypothetical protein [Alphaproteobacteria bacterium]NCT07358.1 hypothetical protein [Alphaproteobacteria bacterium]
MKKIYFTIAAMLLVLAIPQNVQAVGASEISSYVLGKLKGKMSANQLKSLMCEKASFPTKFSIRSASGIACKEVKIALLALKVCGGYKDFDDSHCATNAKKIYKDTSNIVQVMTDAIKNDLKVTGKAFCWVGGIIPAIGDIVNGACEAAGISAGGEE